MSRRLALAATPAAAGGLLEPVAAAAAAAALAQPPPVASSSSPATSSSKSEGDRVFTTSGAAASDLAAVLAAAGWQKCHVLLRQWQCTVAVCAPRSKGSKDKAAAAQAAPAAHADAEQRPAPAIVLDYQAAGVSTVRRRRVQDNHSKAGARLALRWHDCTVSDASTPSFSKCHVEYLTCCRAVLCCAVPCYAGCSSSSFDRRRRSCDVQCR
jgi:hypothetical protein